MTNDVNTNNTPKRPKNVQEALNQITDYRAIGEPYVEDLCEYIRQLESVAAMQPQVSESDEAVAYQNKLNAVYRERVGCSVAFARAALELGWKAGLGLDAKGQQVLYVDTPNGQVSWHIWDTENDLLVGLPQYNGEWDGQFRGRDAVWCVWQHRQSAAVSADAVPLIDQIYAHLKACDVGAANALVVGYGDACRLDGVRRMQEAAAAHMNLKATILGKEELIRTQVAYDKCAQDIRAMSPETVCGGK